MTTLRVTPAQFLDRLFSNVDPGWLSLFTIKDGERVSEWFDTDHVDDMAATATRYADRDVWFGLATRQRALPGRRGGALDCQQIACLWVDVDVAGPNHADTTGMLPDDATARTLIRSFPLPASIVVATGGGYHAYWALDEPLSAEAARPVLARWAATWAAHAATHNCAVDNVFDIARVLRMPGTFNHKRDTPAPVEVLVWENWQYTLDQIHEHTVEPPPPPQRQERNVPYTGAERPGDDFNARHTGAVVLEMDGWVLHKVKPDGSTAYLHPWDPTSDESATVYPEDGRTVIWSDTVVRHRPALETRKAYDPFGLYARLKHDGDMRAATIALAKEGYGAASMRALLGCSTGGGFTDDDTPGVPANTPTEKPYVLVNGRHLDDLADEVVRVLYETNDPPRLFRHGDAVSQLAGSELEAVDRGRMVNIVERTMKPVTMKKDTLHPSRVDAVALDLAMLRLLDGLPPVKAIMRAPFLRANGTVCAEGGYDAASGNYLAGIVHVDVSASPTCEDVRAAVAVIDDMIADFPLLSAADRAHTFALLLTPLVRHLVPLTPLFVMDGNGPGVGKNLLAECCMYVTTGEWVQTDPLPLDGEEQRKQITALLSTGRSVALFDEAHIISGTSLARLITSTTWGDRLLGYSKQVAYPNQITVVALGNNVEVQGDMPRRSILIRLESQLARPYDRQDFRHDDLRQWVVENRARLLGALLTLLVAWHRAGRPMGGARLGSFDQWAAMVGGALRHAGVDGFLGNVREMRERGATDDVDMEAHLRELLGHFMGGSFTTREVARLLENEHLEQMPPRLSRDRLAYSQSLGHTYRRYAGRWLGEVRITEEGITHGARRWRVDTLVAPSAGPSVDNSGDSGGKGGLGGLVLPTREKSWSVVEGTADERLGAKTSPPSPPVPPEAVDPDFDDDPNSIF